MGLALPVEPLLLLGTAWRPEKSPKPFAAAESRPQETPMT